MATITDSQLLQYATELRNLLISYEKANQQISTLGKYLLKIDTYSF